MSSSCLGVLLVVAATAEAAAPAKLVVISGCGSRGIGLGIARQVLSQDVDAEVVVLARSLERATSISDELGPRAHGMQCDVTDAASCAALESELAKLGGGHDLFAVVNNAGYAADLPWFATPWPASAASQTLAVNLFGAERLTRTSCHGSLQRQTAASSLSAPVAAA